MIAAQQFIINAEQIEQVKRLNKEAGMNMDLPDAEFADLECGFYLQDVSYYNVDHIEGYINVYLNTLKDTIAIKYSKKIHDQLLESFQ